MAQYTDYGSGSSEEPKKKKFGSKLREKIGGFVKGARSKFQARRESDRAAGEAKKARIQARADVATENVMIDRGGRRTDDPSKKVGTASVPVAEKTAGGDYQVYKKGSKTAGSFGDAFKAARASGQKVFEWQGRKYNTRKKGESEEDFNRAMDGFANV